MSLAVVREGGAVRVVLEGELTVEGARAMHERLLAEVRAEDVVLVDARAVRRIDTAALQLLFALGRHARALSIEDASEAFAEAWTTSGLARAAERPGAEPAPQEG